MLLALPTEPACVSAIRLPPPTQNRQKAIDLHQFRISYYSCEVPTFIKHLINPSGDRFVVTSEIVHCHYPFAERLVVPAGFALEGLRYAKRVYEKTARRRARNTRQEVHNAKRPAAPPRVAPLSAQQGTFEQSKQRGPFVPTGSAPDDNDDATMRLRCREMQKVVPVTGQEYAAGFIG